MKRIVSLLFSAIFALGCCTAPQQFNISPLNVGANSGVEDKKKDDQVERVRKIKKLTVAVTRLSAGTSTLCSAVWIKRGFLLTANHCIDDEGFMGYVTSDDSDDDDIINSANVKLAIVYAKDKVNDLAVLSVDPVTEPSHENVKFNDRMLEAGEEIDVMGHTVGYKWTYSKGLISSVRTNMSGPASEKVEKILQISAPVWMGNSGGGAFDTNGDFIGLCSWISMSGPFLSFFIHRDVVVAFLKKESIIY